MSSLGKTVTLAAGFGIEVQPAIASEAGTRSNLDGLRSCASAATRLNTNVKQRVAIASKCERLTRGADVGFGVSNGGVVPRRLVVGLFIDCMVLVRIEVELFMVH
jgi:hypothetical protein